MSALITHTTIRVRRDSPGRSCADLPLPPFGSDVIAYATKNGEAIVEIFHGKEGAVSAAMRAAHAGDFFPPERDCWQQAGMAHAFSGRGSALVLPPGKSVEDFSWPIFDTKPRGWSLFGTRLQFWSFGCTHEEAEAIGRALILAGLRFLARGRPLRRPRREIESFLRGCLA